MWLPLLGLFLMAGPSALATSEAPLDSGTEESLPSASQDTIQNYPVRSIGTLRVSNRKGNIIVRGWNQDKIRVIATREGFGATEEEAKKALNQVSYDFRQVGSEIEILTRVAKESTIQDRIAARKENQARLHLRILAPTRMVLELWSVSGSISVQDWDESIKVRNFSGEIEVSKVRAKKINVTCPQCPIALSSINANVHSVGGDRNMRAFRIAGTEHYFETQSGEIEVSDVGGKQTYSSQKGELLGKDLSGDVGFRTQEGKVNLKRLSGVLNGRTLSGAIFVEWLSNEFDGKSFIESESGDLTFELPRRFSGELDLEAPDKQADLEFKLRPLTQTGLEKQVPTSSHIHGNVGDGGELLRLFSRKGSVTVKRRDH